MNLVLASLISLLLQSEPNTACYKNCTISESGLQFIEHFEGYSAFAYNDVAEKKTIGFGHLIRKGEEFKQPLLPPDAEELLQKDAGSSGESVNRLVAIPLAQNQFDALESFTFNLGGGALARSNLLRCINSRRNYEIPAEFQKWSFAGGRKIPGLQVRREAEAKLYGG